MTPESSRAVELLRRRLYRLLESGGGEAHPAPAESMWSPCAEIRVEGPEVVVELEAPGVAREAMDVRLSGSTLTIAGVRSRAAEEQGQRFHQAERPMGEFSRSFTMPWQLEEDSAQATLTDGVLQVRVRRAQPREVPLT
jgi:HSP20 family protein